MNQTRSNVGFWHGCQIFFFSSFFISFYFIFFFFFFFSPFIASKNNGKKGLKKELQPEQGESARGNEERGEVWNGGRFQFGLRKKRQPCDLTSSMLVLGSDGVSSMVSGEPGVSSVALGKPRGGKGSSHIVGVDDEPVLWCRSHRGRWRSRCLWGCEGPQ